MQCRSHVAQLGRLYPELQAAGAEVLVILGDSAERAARYATTLHVPFPIVADPPEVVYHRFGLHKALLLIQRTDLGNSDASPMRQALQTLAVEALKR